MPYIAKLEKAGIPTVIIDYEDQHNMVQENALVYGVPKIRYIAASRTLPGPEDAARLIKPTLEALVKSLSEEEKESGIYNPSQDRVLFEGTLEEAETFYQQTKWIPHPVRAPISVYTDGLPIVIPTEERVKEMLKGTSHKPDEVITLHTGMESFTGIEGMRGPSRKEGEVVRFQPRNWTATVEKVAINAVMAGCKPEHLPVVLAIAQSGCGTGTTVFNGQWVCVSGPIVKELGMNTGVGMFGPGSPANGPIGRAYQLMAINLGGAVPGVNRMNSIGSPLTNAGTCFAEYVDGLPPSWKGLNEEFGFKKDESIVMIGGGGGMQGGQFSPGGYRSLQRSGHGGIARRLGVKGIPGPHNWLEYLVPSLWAGKEGSITFVMVAEMAQHLYEIGFKSKDEVYEWLWKKSFNTVAEYRNRSWPDMTTNGWLGIERTSGKHWKELPDDYMVPFGGDNPSDFCIIVCGSDEEVCQEIGGRGAAYSIDVWR